VTVIDLRASLRAAKRESVVYYKADTHWNTRGAYAAYQEILRVLAADFPEVSAKEWESLGPKAIDRTGFDMARMLGLVPETPEPTSSSTTMRARARIPCRSPSPRTCSRG
jgi:hypothetical protein